MKVDRKHLEKIKKALDDVEYEMNFSCITDKECNKIGDANPLLGQILDGTVNRATCEGCGNEIDPTTCWCGDPIEEHSASSGHPAVPMGCDCLRCDGNDETDIDGFWK